MSVNLMRAGAAALLLGLAAPGLAVAQQGWTGSGETVEDLRYRLGILDAELADIRARLQVLSPGGAARAGGAAGVPTGAGSDAMVRIDRLEVELSRLTGAIEELAFRQRQMSEDAARRFGDLEFRITELEGGDVGALAPQQPLGGTAPALSFGGGGGGGTAGPAPQRQASAPDVSVSESEDLQRAIADIQQGRFDQGEERLERFLASYPGSPLAPEAQFWLGRSSFVRGAFAEAARRHLAGYNLDRGGPMAPRNLLQLGVTLGRLGQVQEACLTLREVRRQFPDAERTVIEAADAERDQLACGG